MSRIFPLSLVAATACLLAGCSPPNTTSPSVVPEAAVAEEADEGGHAGSLVPMMTCAPNAMFNASTTQASLVAAHGQENIREEKVAWVDSQLDALVLFPDDPSMRAEVLWFGDKSGQPQAARVSGGADSLWVGPEGLLLGSSLADIEAANGGPFMVTAFGNHSHGEASDFLGGKLAGADGAACRISLTLDAGPGAPEAAVAAVTGNAEKSFRSDDPALKAAQPVITQMTTLFLKP